MKKKGEREREKKINMWRRKTSRDIHSMSGNGTGRDGGSEKKHLTMLSHDHEQHFTF